MNSFLSIPRLWIIFMDTGYPVSGHTGYPILGKNDFAGYPAKSLSGKKTLMLYILL